VRVDDDPHPSLAGGGNYSFNVAPVTDGAQALTLGGTITGALFTPGQAQRYTFAIATATRLYFDSLTNHSEIRWSLDGPIGNIVANRAFNASDGVNGYLCSTPRLATTP
jgi:hypothetical protein